MKKYIVQSIGVIAIGLVVLFAGFKIIGDGSFVFEEGSQSRVLSEITNREERLSVVLKVLSADDSYLFNTKFIEGESVFEFLERYKLENSEFTFEYDEFEGLGVFVTSIMGKSADPDSEYWKFFVNETESNVGISEYKLTEGDLITFELVEY